MTTTLPEWLRGLRHEMTLTQGDLAHLLGIARATVNRWEAGHTYPNVEMRARLNEMARGCEYPPIVPRWRR